MASFCIFAAGADKCSNSYMAHGRVVRWPVGGREGRYWNLISLIFHMLITEFVGGCCLLRSSAIPRSRDQVSKGFCGFLCDGRQVTNAGLREETREGAKGGNFLLGLDREPLLDPANPFFFFFKIIKSRGCQPSYCNVWRICTKVKDIHYYFQWWRGKYCRNKRCVIALVIVWILDIFFRGKKKTRR